MKTRVLCIFTGDEVQLKSVFNRCSKLFFFLQPSRFRYLLSVLCSAVRKTNSKLQQSLFYFSRVPYELYRLKKKYFLSEGACVTCFAKILPPALKIKTKRKEKNNKEPAHERENIAVAT